jgi:hypothetical protein
MWEGGTELEDVEMDEDLEEALDRVREVSMLRASGYKSLLVQVCRSPLFCWKG